MKVIDANMYWLPEELFTDRELQQKFLACFPREYDVSATAYVLEDGRAAIKVEKPIGCENLNYFQRDYSLEAELMAMDQAGVDEGIMKLPGCQEWISLEICKEFNTRAAEFAAKSGGRLHPLAVVPPYGDDASIAELERCIHELHMTGVQVSAHYGNHYLDDPMFRKFFQKINELNIPVYVHHTPIPVDHKSLLDYNNLRRSFGRCQDQITAIARELFSDLFIDCPNLKMIHSMLGGGYYAFKDMLIPHGSGGGRFDTSDSDRVKECLERNIFFEMSHAQPWGAYGIEVAGKILGADHIIYGSSYPVKADWMLEGPAFVKALPISDRDKELMLYQNAKNIYGVN